MFDTFIIFSLLILENQLWVIFTWVTSSNMIFSDLKAISGNFELQFELPEKYSDEFRELPQGVNSKNFYGVVIEQKRESYAVMWLKILFF